MLKAGGVGAARLPGETGGGLDRVPTEEGGGDGWVGCSERKVLLRTHCGLQWAERGPRTLPGVRLEGAGGRLDLPFGVMGEAARGAGLGGRSKGLVCRPLTLRFWMPANLQVQLLSQQNVVSGFAGRGTQRSAVCRWWLSRGTGRGHLRRL